MDKIVMFVPTGEHRVLNEGDFWIGEYGSILEWSSKLPSTASYDVIRRIVIEIPHQKVKKWKWEHIQNRPLKVVHYTPLSYTEEEMRDNGFELGDDAWHRVPGSEISE